MGLLLLLPVLKGHSKTFFSKVMYSPSHRQTGAPMINFQSARHTAPDLCKNVALAVLFGSNGHTYTIYTQSDMCIYSHVHDIQTLVGQKKLKKKGTAQNNARRGNLSACHFGHACHRLASPVVCVIRSSFPRSKSNHSLSSVEQDRQCTNNVIL